MSRSVNPASISHDIAAAMRTTLSERSERSRSR
jgi:hypothetical protein